MTPVLRTVVDGSASSGLDKTRGIALFPEYAMMRDM
jgi:hypothetical protein